MRGLSLLWLAAASWQGHTATVKPSTQPNTQQGNNHLPSSSSGSAEHPPPTQLNTALHDATADGSGPQADVAGWQPQTEATPTYQRTSRPHNKTSRTHKPTREPARRRTTPVRKQQGPATQREGSRGPAGPETQGPPAQHTSVGGSRPTSTVEALPGHGCLGRREPTGHRSGEQHRPSPREPRGEGEPGRHGSRPNTPVRRRDPRPLTRSSSRLRRPSPTVLRHLPQLQPQSLLQYAVPPDVNQWGYTLIYHPPLDSHTATAATVPVCPQPQPDQATHNPQPGIVGGRCLQRIEPTAAATAQHLTRQPSPSRHDDGPRGQARGGTGGGQQPATSS